MSEMTNLPMGAVEVCGICDIAGCRHIRERHAGLAAMPQFLPTGGLGPHQFDAIPGMPIPDAAFTLAQMRQAEQTAIERAAKVAMAWAAERYGPRAADDIAARIRGIE